MRLKKKKKKKKKKLSLFTNTSIYTYRCFKAMPTLTQSHLKKPPT